MYSWKIFEYIIGRFCIVCITDKALCIDNIPTMRKYLFILIVLLPLCGMAREQSNTTTEQELILLYPSGKELSTDLGSIGRLAFTPDSVYLISHQGDTIGKEARGKIQHIRFADQTHSALSATQGTGDLAVYPNPAHTTLTIDGIMRETTVRIYSTNGALLTTANLSPSCNTLSVAHLTKGIYLLQINTQLLRLIKQ